MIRFWKEPQIKAYLGGVPRAKMVLLDLFGDSGVYEDSMHPRTKRRGGNRDFLDCLHLKHGHVHVLLDFSDYAVFDVVFVVALDLLQEVRKMEWLQDAQVKSLGEAAAGCRKNNLWGERPQS